MVKPKTKSHPSNLQLVSDKDVAISVERLVDSVVKESTAFRSALQPQQESSDGALGFNSLPDEIIEDIFGFLTQNQLGQIARVCQRWSVLTKSLLLWQRIDVTLSPYQSCPTSVAKEFIKKLPSSVTSIKLGFIKFEYHVQLDVEQILEALHERCPHVTEFILMDTPLKNSLYSILYKLSHTLPEVEKLLFYTTVFRSSISSYTGNSNVKVLGLYNCFDVSNECVFSNLTELTHLNLSRTFLRESWFDDEISFLHKLNVLNVGHTVFSPTNFQSVQNHSVYLKELYLCNCVLSDQHLIVDNSNFSQLKTICLSLTSVTCEGVVSLIHSCPSLDNIYVSDSVAQSFAAHNFVVANRSMAAIVKVIDEFHQHNV